MYLPPHFAATDPEALHELIRAHPLGALITCGELGLDANHLPFEFDAGEGEHGVLRAHVARNNPLWQEVKEGDSIYYLAVLPYRNEDTYQFTLKIMGEGQQQTLTFQQTFYVD